MRVKVRLRARFRVRAGIRAIGESKGDGEECAHDAKSTQG